MTEPGRQMAEQAPGEPGSTKTKVALISPPVARDWMVAEGLVTAG